MVSSLKYFRFRTKIDLGIQSGLLPIKNFKIIDFRVELSRMKKKFIQFDEGYNLLKIQNKIEKGDRKNGIFIFERALLHKPICKGFFSDIIFK